MSDRKGIRVAILATDGVEQAELTEPRKFLKQLGAETTLISPNSGEIQALQHHEKGDMIPVDHPLGGANAADYDAVLLPGGAMNADALRMSEEARRFVREADRAEKPLAGLVKGRTMTSYRTIQDDLRNAGADWKDEEVVRDKNWVTSRQPSDIPAFNRAFAELLSRVLQKKAA
jgi:protease I